MQRRQQKHRKPQLERPDDAAGPEGRAEALLLRLGRGGPKLLNAAEELDRPMIAAVASMTGPASPISTTKKKNTNTRLIPAYFISTTKANAL